MAFLIRQPVFALKLSLGRVNCSHRATVCLEAYQIDAFSLLHRWQQGDWGEVEITDPVFKQLVTKNSKALATQSPHGQIVGVYPIGPELYAGEPDLRERVWISGCPFAGKGTITTILLMSEF